VHFCTLLPIKTCCRSDVPATPCAKSRRFTLGSCSLSDKVRRQSNAAIYLFIYFKILLTPLGVITGEGKKKSTVINSSSKTRTPHTLQESAKMYKNKQQQERKNTASTSIICNHITKTTLLNYQTVFTKMKKRKNIVKILIKMRKERKGSRNIKQNYKTQSPLREVNSYKYLGVTIENNLKWGSHVNNICCSAKRTLGYLKRNFRYATMSAKLMVYKTVIRPVLEYANVIWDPHFKLFSIVTPKYL
ncbi:MAG: hypothetical protein O7D30_04920, partial [Rickettsia endosymbiont of Ixodes persulcatus]|nr:hypothetical protein [Rickettsia endosymbiont of Ixodes persulcatus]